MSKQLHETVTPASSYIHSVMLSENPHKPADPESVMKDTELREGEPRTQQLIKAAAFSRLLFFCVTYFLLGVNYSCLFLFVSSRDNRGWSQCRA